MRRNQKELLEFLEVAHLNPGGGGAMSLNALADNRIVGVKITLVDGFDHRAHDPDRAWWLPAGGGKRNPRQKRKNQGHSAGHTHLL
jgi:hypothetical protein